MAFFPSWLQWLGRNVKYFGVRGIFGTGTEALRERRKPNANTAMPHSASVDGSGTEVVATTRPEYGTGRPETGSVVSVYRTNRNAFFLESNGQVSTSGH